MAVGIDSNPGTNADTGGGTSLSFTTGPTVGASGLGNYGLVGTIEWGTSSGTPNPTSISMTWNAVAMTQIVTQSTTQAKSSLYGILLGASTGQKTLAVSWTTSMGACVGAISYSAVDQTGFATTFIHTNSGTGTTSSPSLTVTSATNNYTIAQCGATANDFTNSSNQGVCIVSGAGPENQGSYTIAGAASVSYTWPVNWVSPDAWVAVGCDIAFLGTVGGSTPFIQREYFDLPTARLRRVEGSVGFMAIPLIGNDKFYGLGGPTYDWPLPGHPPSWNVAKTFTWNAQNELLGQQPFVQLYDQPNPRGPVQWKVAKTWTWDAQITLPSHPLPSFDLPTPTLRRLQQDPNIQNLLGTTLFVVVFVPPPPGQYDWPNPQKIRMLPVPTVYREPIVAAQPFGQFDWPNPAEPHRLQDPDIQHLLNTTLATIVFIPPPPGMYDWPTPGRVRLIKADSPQNLFETLFTVPPPFVTPDLSLPSKRTKQDLSWQTENQVIMIPQVVQHSHLYFVDWKYFTFQGNDIITDGPPRIVSIKGRLAFQIKGMIYMWLD